MQYLIFLRNILSNTKTEKDLTFFLKFLKIDIEIFLDKFIFQFIKIYKKINLHKT